MKLQAPFETSFGRIESRDCIILSGFGNGLTGLGECVADRDPGYSYETVDTAWHILKDFLIPRILNKEVEHPSELPELFSFVKGHPLAKASLEMVYWDLLGKQSNMPLVRMLGGTREQVEVGVSVGIQDSPQILVKTVENYLEQGYRRVKIKIKPNRDLEETRLIRKSFPDIRLQVDANSAYSFKDALILKKLDDLDLLLIEQPLAEDDIIEHSRLQKLMNTPLCLDESILTLRHTRDALEMDACRVINIKSARVGGLTEALLIHNHCQSKNIPVWCGGMLETGVGRAANLALASLPGFTLPGDISATRRYYKEDITQQVFSLNQDSTITVPTGYGLGVDINESALRRNVVRQLIIQ